MHVVEPAVVPAPSRWSLLRSGITDCLIALGIYTALSMAPSLVKPYSPGLWLHEDRWNFYPGRIDEARLERWVRSQPDTSHVKVWHEGGYRDIVIRFESPERDLKLEPEWAVSQNPVHDVDRTTRRVSLPYEWWDDWEFALAALAVGAWRIRHSLRYGVPILRPFAGQPIKALAWGVILGAVFGLGIGYGANAIPWYPHTRSSEVDHAVLPTATTFVKATVLMWAWLLAPISEEVLMRGAFLGRLAAAGYVRFGVLASAIVFALIHFDVAMLIPAFIAGLLAGLLYLRTRSLLTPIAFHILWNVMQNVHVHVPR